MKVARSALRISLSLGERVGVEIDPLTYAFAKANLREAGYRDLVLVNADGGLGYPERWPHNRISVTAACREVPPPLSEQLFSEQSKLCRSLFSSSLIR